MYIVRRVVIFSLNIGARINYSSKNNNNVITLRAATAQFSAIIKKKKTKTIFIFSTKRKLKKKKLTEIDDGDNDKGTETKNRQVGTYDSIRSLRYDLRFIFSSENK